MLGNYFFQNSNFRSKSKLRSFYSLVASITAPRCCAPVRHGPVPRWYPTGMKIDYSDLTTSLFFGHMKDLFLSRRALYTVSRRHLPLEHPAAPRPEMGGVGDVRGRRTGSTRRGVAAARILTRDRSSDRVTDTPSAQARTGVSDRPRSV